MKHTQIAFIAIPFLAFSLVGAGCAKPAEQPATPSQSTTTAAAPPSSAPSSTAPAPAPAPKPTTTTTKPKTTTTTTAPKPNVVTITITGMRFSPQTLAVSAGTTIVWVNKDTVPHTVTSDGALLWDSGTIRPGASFSHVFKAPGGYNYHCGIHPTMTGSVIVR